MICLAVKFGCHMHMEFPLYCFYRNGNSQIKVNLPIPVAPHVSFLCQNSEDLIFMFPLSNNNENHLWKKIEFHDVFFAINVLDPLYSRFPKLQKFSLRFRIPLDAVVDEISYLYS